MNEPVAGQGTSVRREEHQPITSSSTVGDYLEAWLTGKRSLRPSTYASHEAHVRRYLVPYLGQLPLDGLRSHHIERMYRLLADQGGQRRGPLSESGMRRIHSTLATAMNAAVDSGLLDRSPSATVTLPGAPERGRTARAGIQGGRS